jgi:hypothetical protein
MSHLCEKSDTDEKFLFAILSAVCTEDTVDAWLSKIVLMWIYRKTYISKPAVSQGNI